MRRLPLVLLLATLGATQATAGVFDDEEARRQIVDLRAKSEARFDQQGRAQLELAAQIQRQSEEIARLRGQVETLNYALETAQKRQQDFYMDLDTRLRRFESAASADVAVDPAAGQKPADPARESKEYDAALELFKGGRYKEAAASFAAFVQSSPNSTLAPNAQFWLGNAWYAQHNCAKAIEAQTVVTSKYASSAKAPDAWLAIATCQQELGNKAAAKRSLDTLLEKYPSAPAAESARERLKKK
jgi:tol-pal system protein YbgF